MAKLRPFGVTNPEHAEWRNIRIAGYRSECGLWVGDVNTGDGPT